MLRLPHSGQTPRGACASSGSRSPQGTSEAASHFSDLPIAPASPPSASSPLKGRKAPAGAVNSHVNGPVPITVNGLQFDAITMARIAAELLKTAPANFTSMASGRALNKESLNAALAAATAAAATAAAASATTAAPAAPYTLGVSASPAASPSAATLHRPVPASLKHVQTIGSGGFGRVALVRCSVTRRMYALKTIRKAHILSYNGQVRSRLIALDCHRMPSIALDCP